MPTIELQISGKVQGVFFRASTREQAEALGLQGWVRNMPDGSVLLRATGPEELLAKLEAWCLKGPDRAVVAQVKKEILPNEAFDGFRVTR